MLRIVRTVPVLIKFQSYCISYSKTKPQSFVLTKYEPNRSILAVHPSIHTKNRGLASLTKEGLRPRLLETFCGPDFQKQLLTPLKTGPQHVRVRSRRRCLLHFFEKHLTELTGDAGGSVQHKF